MRSLEQSPSGPVDSWPKSGESTDTHLNKPGLVGKEMRLREPVPNKKKRMQQAAAAAHCLTRHAYPTERPRMARRTFCIHASAPHAFPCSNQGRTLLDDESGTCWNWAGVVRISSAASLFSGSVYTGQACMRLWMYVACARSATKRAHGHVCRDEQNQARLRAL